MHPQFHSSWLGPPNSHGHSNTSQPKGKCNTRKSRVEISSRLSHLQFKYLTSRKMVTRAPDHMNTLGLSQGNACASGGLWRLSFLTCMVKCPWPARFWIQTGQSHTRDLEDGREAEALLPLPIAVTGVSISADTTFRTGYRALYCAVHPSPTWDLQVG